MRRRRALLFDPYLHTLGGGERYLLAVADALAGEVDVTVAGLRPPTRDAYSRAGLPDGHRTVRIPWPLLVPATAAYDHLVHLTNRPPLPSLARRSHAVVQFPFVGLRTPSLAGRWWSAALRGYECVAYSEFSAEWTRRRWGRAATVLPPPVEGGSPDWPAKERLIVAVGRFFVRQSCKRQDVLVEAFRRLPEQVRSSWRLVLAGQVDDHPGARAYVDELRRSARGLAVTVETDVTRPWLLEQLRRASLFWHAAGVGRAADQPERAEHFGIATVEAMSFGAVPLVHDDGGQREVVEASSGVRWATVDELVAATTRLAGDDALRRRLAEAAALRSRHWTQGDFAERARAVFLDAPVGRAAAAVVAGER